MSTEVLIVDDDVAMGEMLCGRLRRHGFIASSRTSAAEALRSLEEKRPDVIVTDIDMPGMSGLDFCRRLRAGGSQIPVIVITAFGTFDTAIQALRAGAWDFVTKPFDVDQLIPAIERAAGGRSPDGTDGARVVEIIAGLPEADGLEKVERLVSAGRHARSLIHDLGTPLNVVLGHAQLLGSEDLTQAEVRESARAIVEQAKRMTRLMREVLADDDAQAGRVATQLHDVVAAAVARVAPLAQKRNIDIVVDAATGPVSVVVQAQRLQHVFEHLLTNGVQSMDSGGRLRVQLDRSRAPLHDGTPADTLCITVEDTGCGIPPAHLEKIFRTFFTTKRESGCAGLGLMVCHHVVRAHGGTIAVDSTPGQGSRFVVRLPVTSPAAAGAESLDLVRT